MPLTNVPIHGMSPDATASGDAALAPGFFMSTGMAQFDARSTRRPRGWGRLWQTPVFLLGLLSLGLVAATAPLRTSPARDFARELRHLRQALAGQHDLPDAATFVAPLLAQAGEFPRYESECEYLVGSYFYQRAQLDPKTPEWAGQAIKHLSRALMLTVADDDLPSLLYRLGMTQYEQGQHRAQALNLIRQGLDLGAENPVKGFAFLIEAYLQMSPPNLGAALAASERHREYVNDWDAEALGQARYLHADILQRLERHNEALRELEQIDAKISAPLLARVRLLQAHCSEHEGLWNAAIGFWTQLQVPDLAEHVPGGKGRVLYARGLAHTHAENVDDEMVISLWKQASVLGGEEAQAANIRLGHRLVTGNRHEPERALMHWAAAVAAVRVSSDYKNRYIDVAAGLELFDQACDRLVAQGDFARAQTLANLLARVASQGTAEEKIARVTMRWADALTRLSETTPAESDKHASEARARYQDAGDLFKQATLSREAAAKIELYWQSATCYVAARDFTNAAMVLEKFVALTRADDRLAQGHFALAEAYQAQAQRLKAREHYLKCIELNKPPFVYRALSKLAQAEIDARKLDNAREILVQIITRNGPDLDRAILEQSMYALGKILFDLGEPEEGAVRYREAIREFPANAQVWKAREKLADHARDRARQISVPELLGVAPERRPLAEAMWQKRQESLQEAHDAYQGIARDLEVRYHSRKQLPKDEQLPMEEILLWRNSLHNVGVVKIDMGNYPEALTYFRQFQLLYAGQPESLHAARMIHFCWQQMALQPERARYKEIVVEAVQTALRDLDKIPRTRDEEVFLSGPNPYSRDQWRQLLAHWESELQHVALRVNNRSFAPQE